MSFLDPRFSGSIYRKNFPNIIASDRALAKIVAVRMAYSSTAYVAGQVIARVTATGFYSRYDDAVTGGYNTAVGVLLDEVDLTAATGSGAGGYGTGSGRMIVGGAQLYYDKLTGIDANGLTDLKARVVVDEFGTNLLVW